MAFEDFQNQDRRARVRIATADSLYDTGLRQHMLGGYNYMFAGGQRRGRPSRPPASAREPLPF